jgi:predicted short-subunit dehydrogenase-like oxidoreductase (DUF2520 family)
MKVVIIGAGNVGSHLAKALHQADVRILQVFNRNIEKAQSLALQVNAEPVCDYKALSDQADLYLLTVSDSAIEEVAERITQVLGRNILLAHTSGATPSSVFEGKTNRYGVFYPLQTFSKEQKVDFSNIPFCLDAVKKEDRVLLQKLAALLSKKVFIISDEQRAVLHVAAVFVNNFSNHLFHIGDNILKAHNMPFELLIPLIKETANKLDGLSPNEAQTGPAIRGDQTTIRRHLKLLKSYPEYQEIYRMLSEGIQKR